MLNVPPTKRQSIAVPGCPGPSPCLGPGSSKGSSEWRDWREESCRRNVAELLARHVLDITTATA